MNSCEFILSFWLQISMVFKHFFFNMVNFKFFSLRELNSNLCPLISQIKSFFLLYIRVVVSS